MKQTSTNSGASPSANGAAHAANPNKPDSNPDVIRKLVFLLAAAACFSPWISPPIALFMGLIIALTMGHPFLHLNKKATNYLLKASVVGLGFGMNIQTAMHAGKQGVLFTIVSIFGTLILGTLIARWLKIEAKTSYLVSSGTAICGGSAIAAVAPVIGAEEKSISVALGIVFILNSIALFIFPVLGHWLHLSENQFGIWCAIAIHDTSSVVGAASSYGKTALEVATTVKLARALWIIPVAFVSAFLFKSKSKKINIPWFIGMFIIAMVIYTYVPFVNTYGHYVVDIARKGLTLTLFLIGAGLSRKVIQSVGIKPFIQGIILWVVISISALWAAMHFVS
jgi:uncharacterized integral membrane protein (TIGR00698 family)